MGKKMKAQLAVETLLIYGIAILIVMLAIGALIGFGILDLGGLLPDQCQLGDLGCNNYVISSSGVQIELLNSLGKNINKIEINISGEKDYEGVWSCTQTAYTSFTANGDVTDPIKINCSIAVPPGKKIQGIITANVTFAGSQIGKIIKGNIRSTVS